MDKGRFSEREGLTRRSGVAEMLLADLMGIDSDDGSRT